MKNRVGVFLWIVTLSSLGFSFFVYWWSGPPTLRDSGARAWWKVSATVTVGGKVVSGVGVYRSLEGTLLIQLLDSSEGPTTSEGGYIVQPFYGGVRVISLDYFTSHGNFIVVNNMWPSSWELVPYEPVNTDPKLVVKDDSVEFTGLSKQRIKVQGDIMLPYQEPR